MPYFISSDLIVPLFSQRLEAGLNSQEKELFSIANIPENKEKNRFLNILPCKYFYANLCFHKPCDLFYIEYLFFDCTFVLT